MYFYCTAPILNCNDPKILNIYYNTTSIGIESCTLEMKRRISSRIYLAVAIFNCVFVIGTTFLFVYCSRQPDKSPTDPTYDNPNRKEIRKAHKQYSLKKRSPLATALGAFGNLVFSTCVFLIQAFNNETGCQLILWGVIIGFYTWVYAIIIRAYRLRFLFRLNQLKVRYLRMSTADRIECINDNDYRWYLINSRKKETKLRLPYVIYGISICIIIAVTVPSVLYAVNETGRCRSQWGAATLVGSCGLFIVVIAPVSIWYLRGVSDSHGIRIELLFDIIVAIPFFIVYFTWFLLIKSDTIKFNFYLHRIFSPANWVVFFLFMAHIVAVVVPIIQYYFPFEIKKYKQLKKKIKLMSDKVFICKKANDLDNPESDLDENQEIHDFIPELSIESLERALTDPDFMNQLQDLAIKDFSSENLLFYEKYLQLEEKFKSELIKNRVNFDRVLYNTQENPKSWIDSLTKKPSTSTPKASVHLDQQKQNKLSLEQYLSLPLPYKLYQDCSNFYQVYIKNGAPHQINISYSARINIDRTFEHIYERYPEILSEIHSDVRNSKTESFYLNSDERQDKYCNASKNNPPNINIVNKAPSVEHNESVFVLSLGAFEEARREVCWNIFNSVYPTLVKIYSDNNTCNINNTTLEA